MAIDLGFLAQAGMRGLAGYRQGQRLAREDEQEEARNLFSEWARKQQLGLQQQGLTEQSRLREATLMQNRELQEANRAEAARRAAEGLAAQNERATADREMRERLAQMQQAGREDLARLTASLRQPPQEPAWTLDTNKDNQRVRVNTRTGQVEPLGYEAKPTGQGGGFSLSARTRIADELSDLADIVARAEASAGGIEGAGNVTGPIMGRASGILEAIGMYPQKKVAAVSNMENVGSAVRLARSGTAVSKYELQNLGFIPTKNMPEAGVATRLRELSKNAAELLMRKLEFYESQGVDLSGVRAKLSGLGGGAPPPKYKENPY